ncbi:hypothetical protein FRC12_024852 [Ceratobasidium sp. 428]|nr:hypothetical protein FRC12_024852 [Ceratobasidium sp. 428]
MSNLLVLHLECSTGSSNVAIFIAQCTVSGSWCKANTGNLSKFAQSFDLRVTEKPNIDSFLALHPMSNDDNTDARDNANESGQDHLLPLSHTATVESVESVGYGGTTGGTNRGEGNNQDYGWSVVDSELGFDGSTEGESGRGDGFDKGDHPNGQYLTYVSGLLAQSVNSGMTLQE